MRGLTAEGIYNQGFVPTEGPLELHVMSNGTGSAKPEMGNRSLANEKQQTMKTELDRPVLQQKHFKEFYQQRAKPPAQHIKKVGQYCRKQCTCSRSKLWQMLQRKIPVLYWVPRYDYKANGISDLIGGLTVGIMQIPQGMGYALLAEMPPVMGLYVSFFAVLIYFFLGTSRHLSQGTFSVISLMTANVVNSYLHSKGSDNSATAMFHMSTTESLYNISTTTLPTTTTTENPRAVLQTESVYLAISISFMVGIMQIVMSFVQLGSLSVYLSENLVSGFTTGAAVHVFTSQIKYFLGIHVHNFRGFLGIIYIYGDVFQEIKHTNLITLAMGICVVTVLILVNDCVNLRFKDKLIMPIPIELIVVVITTLVSYYTDLHGVHGVGIVEHIPNGIPFPELPRFDMMSNVVGGAFSISVVSFCISVSLTIIFAKRGGYDIDPNQELFAYGVANLFSSFFSCFPCCASLSRSTVQVNSGSKTQLASILAAILVLIALLFLGPCFEPIPICVLSGIIMVALRKLFYQVSDCIAAWKVSRMDAIIWIVTFWAVVLCDVDYGLIISIGFLLIVFLFRAQRPYTTILGNVPNTETYLDITKYRAPKEVKGIKIIHFGGALYFANVEFFRQTIYKLVFNPLEVYDRMKKREKAAKRLEEKAIKQKQQQQAKDVIVFPVAEVPAKVSNGSSIEVVTFHSDLTTTDIFERRLSTYGNSRLPPQPVPGTIKAIIIDCSAVSFIDAPGLSMIDQLLNEYKKIDVELCLAGCRDKVSARLEKSIFYPDLERNVFPTIHDAVLHTVSFNVFPERIVVEDYDC